MYMISTPLFLVTRKARQERTFLISSPRSLNDFRNFPRCANLRCIGYAAMLMEHGDDQPIATAVHAPQFLLLRRTENP